MKEFALIFRLKDVAHFKPSPEQMQERMNWLGSIAAQNKLVDRGNTLLPVQGSAKTVKPGNLSMFYELRLCPASPVVQAFIP